MSETGWTYDTTAKTWRSPDRVGPHGHIVGTDVSVPSGQITSAMIVDGTIVSADLNSEAWTTWSPVVTQGVTPTQTVNRATYIKLGRLVIAEARITFTGAGTAGTQILLTGLPSAGASASDINGFGRYFDSGNVNHVVQATGTTTTSVFFSVQGDGNSFGVGGNPSGGIANNDFLVCTIIYEAAT